MINIADTTRAATEILQDNLAGNYKVERGERINFSADIATRRGWVGVYRGRVSATPRSVGNHAASWNYDFELRLVLQAASHKSSSDAEDKLEQAIQDTLTILLQNQTLDSNTRFIKSWTVEYRYLDNNSGSLHFQAAD